MSTPSTTASSTTTTTAAPSGSFTCSDPAGTDVSASLNACSPAASPVGATWNGEGATYIVNEGISIPHSMTLTDATLVDQTAWANQPTLHMAPIVLVDRVNNVTLSDLQIYGAHTDAGTGGRYQASQAGIRLRSANSVTISNVQTFNTWGDGLETTRNAPVTRLDNLPVMYLNVEGFTSTNAVGTASPAGELQDSVVNHITCINSARTPVNFESDVPYTGSGYDIIANCNVRRINIVEYVYGPIDVDNCTGLLGMLIHRKGVIVPATVTVTNSTFTCHRASPVPCISQEGGNVDLDQDTIGREDGNSPTRDPAPVRHRPRLDVGGRLEHRGLWRAPPTRRPPSPSRHRGLRGRCGRVTDHPRMMVCGIIPG